MAFFIGQGGSVEFSRGVSTGTLCVENWQIEVRNDAQDVTTTCSGGFIDRIAGISDATLTFTGFFDAAASILSPIQPGFDIDFTANIGTAGGSIDMKAIVTSVSVENPAKATVKFTVTAQSTGEITFNFTG